MRGGRLYLSLALASVLLAACMGEWIGDSAANRSLGYDFGNAIGHNEALQVIDPRPVAAGEQAPALDGRRAAAAMNRYRNGAVRSLEIERTADSKTE